MAPHVPSRKKRHRTNFTPIRYGLQVLARYTNDTSNTTFNTSRLNYTYHVFHSIDATNYVLSMTFPNIVALPYPTGRYFTLHRIKGHITRHISDNSCIQYQAPHLSHPPEWTSWLLSPQRSIATGDQHDKVPNQRIDDTPAAGIRACQERPT